MLRAHLPVGSEWNFYLVPFKRTLHLLFSSRWSAYSKSENLSSNICFMLLNTLFFLSANYPQQTHSLFLQPTFPLKRRSLYSSPEVHKRWFTISVLIFFFLLGLLVWKQKDVTNKRAYEGTSTVNALIRLTIKDAATALLTMPWWKENHSNKIWCPFNKPGTLAAPVMQMHYFS